MTTSHLRCIDGPHKGEWRDVDWTYDCVLLVRDAGPKGVEKDSHLPTLEYMHQMVQGMIEKTIYRATLHLAAPAARYSVWGDS